MGALGRKRRGLKDRAFGDPGEMMRTRRGRGIGSPSRRGKKRSIGQSDGPGEGEAGKSVKRQKKKKEKTVQQGDVGQGGGERKTSLFPRKVPKARRKEKEKTGFL